MNEQAHHPDYPVVDKKHLARGLREGFSNTYLTLLSIVQGVAFGATILNGARILQLEANQLVRPNDLLTWTMLFISGTIIVIVWYEYSWFVRVFVWSPTPVDAVIPFAMGTLEILPTFLLHEPKWWAICTSLFLFAGTLTYLNSWSHCERSTFDPACLGTYMRSLFKRRYVIMMSLIALVSLVMCVIGLTLIARPNLSAGLFIFIAIVTYTVIVWTAEEEMHEILGAYGLVKPVAELSAPRRWLHDRWHWRALISCSRACKTVIEPTVKGKPTDVEIEPPP